MGTKSHIFIDTPDGSRCTICGDREGTGIFPNECVGCFGPCSQCEDEQRNVGSGYPGAPREYDPNLFCESCLRRWELTRGDKREQRRD